MLKDINSEYKNTIKLIEQLIFSLNASLGRKHKTLALKLFHSRFLLLLLFLIIQNKLTPNYHHIQEKWKENEPGEKTFSIHAFK